MKRFFSVLSIVLMMIVVAPHADAKKFGGGKSFGKSYKTAPAPSSSPSNTGSINRQSDRNNQGAPASANPASGKKGLMGGMLGGLLAGGLLAALFAGGAFEGFQFGDFIFIAAILFTAFMVIRAIKGKKRTAQAYASAPQYGNTQSNTGYYHRGNDSHAQPQANNAHFARSHTDVPFNFAPQFDKQAFLNGARDHYRILQEAWNKNQLSTIQEYVSIELYNELSKERASLSEQQHTEVMYVDVEFVRADYLSEQAELSLKFSGRYRDTVEGIEEDIKDVWHLERDLTKADAPWLIVGIE